MIPRLMVQMRGGMFVKAKTVNTGTMRMVQTSRMMPRRPTKSCNQQRQASKASSSIGYESQRHTHPYSYYETPCDSHENQRACINSSGNTGRLLLAVVAELVEEELTGSDTHVYHNYKRASVHH